MLFRDVAPLDDSAEAAAAILGDVDAETLIKDYWVTEALRILSDQFGEYFVFKGGTSLTKAVGCVDRFSEDLDILITAKPDGQSYSGLMKSMITAVEAGAGIDGDLKASSRNVSRAVSFTYPTRHEGLFKPEILLEMGIRGTDVPNPLVYGIRPMLADVPGLALDGDRYPDLRRFDVRVLHPVRTLWEKIVLLHTDVESGAWRENPDPSRFARHYGDIGALLSLPDVQDLLADAILRATLDQEVRQNSEQWFKPAPAVPEGGYANSPAFLPSGDFGAFLDRYFEETVERLWAPASRPSLEGVLNIVQSNSMLVDPLAD